MQQIAHLQTLLREVATVLTTLEIDVRALHTALADPATSDHSTVGATAASLYATIVRMRQAELSERVAVALAAPVRAPGDPYQQLVVGLSTLEGLYRTTRTVLLERPVRTPQEEYVLAQIEAAWPQLLELLLPHLRQLFALQRAVLHAEDFPDRPPFAVSA